MRGGVGTPGPGRRSVVVTGTVVAALLVVGAAALGGPLHFGGPRWSPRIALPSATTQAGPTAATTPTAGTGAHGHRSVTHLDVTWVLVVAGVLAAIVVLVLVVRMLGRRLRRGGDPVLPTDVLGADAAPDGPPSAAAMRTVRRGLARALDVIDDRDRAPSDAITAAWLGLQEAAEDAGHRRQPAETPTEFTARVLLGLDLDRGAVTTLRDLYVVVRFGTTPVGPVEVAAARDALRTLQSRWPGGPTADRAPAPLPGVRR